MPTEQQCAYGSILFDFHHDSHLDPPYSHGIVWGLSGMLVYFMIRSLMIRAKSLRLAREADAAVDPNAPLNAGLEFVSGKVEYAQDKSYAITVKVEQRGTETESKNGWSHQWSEVDRKTKATPFYLRRPDGARVRVEPGDNPLLVDKLDRTKLLSRETRIRSAKLSKGETAFVQGELTRGRDPEALGGSSYREAGLGWIMVPKAGERMEVSAEKLGDRHRKRANAMGRTAKAMVVTMAILNLCFYHYHLRLFMGHDTCAQVTGKQVVTSKDSKGRTSYHHAVYVKVDAPNSPSDSDIVDDFDYVQLQRDSVIAYRYVPSEPEQSMVGWSSSVNAVSIFLAALIWATGLAMFLTARNYRRWYERKLENSGEGRLPELE